MAPSLVCLCWQLLFLFILVFKIAKNQKETQKGSFLFPFGPYNWPHAHQQVLNGHLSVPTGLTWLPVGLYVVIPSFFLHMGRQKSSKNAILSAKFAQKCIFREATEIQADRQGVILNWKPILIIKCPTVRIQKIIGLVWSALGNITFYGNSEDIFIP